MKGERRLDLFRWGLVPSSARDMRNAGRLINARAETLGERTAFRSALVRRRCVVPADGFYEWRRPGAQVDAKNPASHVERETLASRGEKKRSQPFWFWRADGHLCAFAGLWEVWRDPAGGVVRTVAIVTTAAGRDMEDVHHRMPVILEEGVWQQWLETPPEKATSLGVLLGPAPEGTLLRRPVSSAVNSARSDGPDLIYQIH